MRDASHDKPAACDCCAEAERNPLSGLYRSDCMACLVRRLARAPRSERERVYAGDGARCARAARGGRSGGVGRLRGACAAGSDFNGSDK